MEVFPGIHTPPAGEGGGVEGSRTRVLHDSVEEQLRGAGGLVVAVIDAPGGRGRGALATTAGPGGAVATEREYSSTTVTGVRVW